MRSQLRGSLSSFTAWPLTLAHHGLSGFYANVGIADHTPHYLWILWSVGLFTQAGKWSLDLEQAPARFRDRHVTAAHRLVVSAVEAAWPDDPRSILLSLAFFVLPTRVHERVPLIPNPPNLRLIGSAEGRKDPLAD